MNDIQRPNCAAFVRELTYLFCVTELVDLDAKGRDADLYHWLWCS